MYDHQNFKGQKTRRNLMKRFSHISILMSLNFHDKATKAFRIFKINPLISIMNTGLKLAATETTHKCYNYFRVEM